MNIWFASGNAHKKAELTAILANAIPGISDCNVLIPSEAGLDFSPEETGTSFRENALLKARELYSLLVDRRPPAFTRGDPIIADDSGICVDALNGRPGIFSARYTGIRKDLTQRRGGAEDGELPENGAQPSLNPGISKISIEGRDPAYENSVPSCLCVRNSERNYSAITISAAQRNALLLEELGSNPRRSARFVCAMALVFSPERFFLAQETLEGEIVSGPQAARGSGGFGYDPILFIPKLNRTVAELSQEEKNTISHRAKAGKIIAAILRELSCRE